MAPPDHISVRNCAVDPHCGYAPKKEPKHPLVQDQIATAPRTYAAAIAPWVILGPRTAGQRRSGMEHDPFASSLAPPMRGTFRAYFLPNHGDTGIPFTHNGVTPGEPA